VQRRALEPSYRLAIFVLRPALTLLGTLTVTDVKRGGLVISCSQGRANRGIHASAKQHNRTRFL